MHGLWCVPLHLDNESRADAEPHRSAIREDTYKSTADNCYGICDTGPRTWKCLPSSQCGRGALSMGTTTTSHNTVTVSPTQYKYQWPL